MPVVLTHAQGLESEPCPEVATESVTNLMVWKKCNRLATYENAMLMNWLESQGYPGIPSRSRSRKNIKRRLQQRGQIVKAKKWIHENTDALKKLIRYPPVSRNTLIELLWRMVEKKMDEEEKILAKAADFHDASIIVSHLTESELIPPGLQWIVNHPGLLLTKVDCIGRLEVDCMQYESLNACPDQATRNQFELCRGHADMLQKLYDFKDRFHFERMRQQHARNKEVVKRVEDEYQQIKEEINQEPDQPKPDKDDIDPDEFLRSLDEKYLKKEDANGQADR